MCALAVGLVGCGSSGDSEENPASPNVGLKFDRPYIGEPIDSKLSATIGAALASSEGGYKENPFRGLPCFEYSNPERRKWKAICDIEPRYGPKIRCLAAEPLGNSPMMETNCRSHPDKPGWEQACFERVNRYKCEIFAARGAESCEAVGSRNPAMLMCTGVGLASRNFTSPRGRERW